MRRLVIILIACAFALTTEAQQLRRYFVHELAVGVSGGATFSRVGFLHNNTYRSNELGNQTFCPNYRMGVAVRYISQKHFGIQMEFNFLRAGWSEKYYEQSGETMVNGFDLQNVELSRSLNYFEIPVLAHIYFGKRKVHFFVNLGPEVSILTKYGDLKWNISEGDARRTAIPDDDPRLGSQDNNWDYGLTGGMGLDIQVGKFHAIIEGRYVYGFHNIYNSGKADVFQRSNNQMLNVTASFLVPVLKFTEHNKINKAKKEKEE